jgi:hypothetical protein
VGKIASAFRPDHPNVRRCSELMVSAISCTKLDVASKGAAWPAPSIWRVLAVGMVDASERLRRTMLLGLREPSALDKITWCVVDAIRTAGRGRPVLQIRNLRPGL